MNRLNIPKMRCLILSKDKQMALALEPLLHKLGYSSEVEQNRKNAVHRFLQNKPSLIISEADYLPNNPNRVVQLFKMAHRSPGVLILKNKLESIGSYSYVKDGIFTSIDKPVRTEDLIYSIKRTEDHLKMASKIFFLKDVLVNVGLALPLLVLLTYLMVAD